MNKLIYSENGNPITISDNAWAFTCKANEYIEVYIKDGKTYKRMPSEYDYVENFFLGNIYIIAKNNNIVFPKENNIEDIIVEGNVLYNNTDILDSMLSLYQNMKPGKMDNWAKKIINWCQKYGFPFINNYEDTVSCYKLTGYVGFQLSAFYHHLQKIYLTICMHHKLDDSILISNKDTSSFLQLYSEDDLKKSIADILNFSARSQEQIYYFDDYVLKMKISYNGLIGLAYHQLSMLLLSPDGFSAKHCKCCQSLFAVSNQNREYCINCSPQKYYAKQKRLHQKIKKQQKGD